MPKNSLDKVLEKIKDYLSYRDHSEYELMSKLIKKFEKDQVIQAITKAKKHKLLTDPKELSFRTVEGLNKKHKGWLFIKKILQKKQLPMIPKSEKKEEEKCKWWLQKKFNSVDFSPNDIKKMYNYLSYRGFESSTIRKAVSDYIHSSS